MIEDKWKSLFSENKDKLIEKFELQEDHEFRFAKKLNTQFQRKPVSTYNYWKVAAVLIPLLMLVCYFAIEFSENNKLDNPNEDLTIYSHDLDQAQNQFSYLIQAKMEKVKAMENTTNQKLINDSFSKLQSLQKNYNQLLNDLQESGGNPQVIRSVLLNLQLQVEVLESTLNQIENLQDFKQRQDGKNI